MSKKLTWLNVTGVPRSGTTALGAALNKSKNISLLHEHHPKQFLAQLNHYFITRSCILNGKGLWIYMEAP
jgi:hypothetical protein